jgi:hypothetical protein
MGKFKVGDKVEIVSLKNTQKAYGGESFISPVGTVSEVVWINNDEVEISEDGYSYHVKDLKLLKDKKILQTKLVEDEVAQQVEVDNVNSPNHYSSQSIECIVAMEAMLSKEEFIGYLRGKLIEMEFKTTGEDKV